MSRRTPSSSNTAGKRSNSSNNTNNNTSDYDLLAKITKDPHYVNRMRGVDAPPPPSATSAMSAPFTRNNTSATGGAAFAPRSGASNALGLGGGGNSGGGMARLWDNHYTQERIPQYDAVNDRYCKFNLKQRAESVGGNNTQAAGTRKTASGGIQRNQFASSAVIGGGARGIGSAGANDNRILAPLSARSTIGGRLGANPSAGPPSSSNDGYSNNTINNMHANNTMNNDVNANNNNNNGLPINLATSSSGDTIESLYQKSRYRLLALWEELGTPEADRAPLGPSMMLLPGQGPSVEAIRTITNEIQRLVDLRNSAVEVEKAIELREGFLYLLQELSERFAAQASGATPADRDKAYRELVALVTPFRNASLQVVEGIGRWREVYSLNAKQTNNVAAQLLNNTNNNNGDGQSTIPKPIHSYGSSAASSSVAVVPPYMWKGVSYLHKMNGDTYFLIHSRLGALLEYEVRGNPLLDPRKIKMSSDGTTNALPPVRVKNAVGVGAAVGGLNGGVGSSAAAAAVPFARITKAEQVLLEEAQRQLILRDVAGGGGRAMNMSPAEEAEMIRRRARGDDDRAVAMLREETQWASHYADHNNNNNNNMPSSGGNFGRNNNNNNNGAFNKMSPIEIQNAAATNIQRVFKGHLARRYVDARREQVDSATRIQRFVRKVLARKEVARRREQVEAARRIQALQRGVSTRSRIGKVRHAHSAATLIQKVFRGYLTRKYTDMVRYLTVCATKIQSTWRSYYVRQHVRGEIIYVRHQAATKIQSLWRGHYVRGIARYNPIKVRRVVKLQAWFRGILDRRRIRDLIIRRIAATRIQAVYRMVLAKRRCQAIRQDREDKSWEVYLGVASTAATRIQSGWRMLAAKLRVRKLKEARRVRQQHEAESAMLEEQLHSQEQLVARHRAATRVQSLVRGHLARQQVAMLRYLIASTITMQRVVRGRLGRLRANAQRAVLVAYMEEKATVPGDKSKILPATSFVAEALSALQLEETNTAAAADSTAAASGAADESLMDVSAVVADAAPNAAPTHAAAVDGDDESSKNVHETPAEESNGSANDTTNNDSADATARAVAVEGPASDNAVVVDAAAPAVVGIAPLSIDNTAVEEPSTIVAVADARERKEDTVPSASIAAPPSAAKKEEDFLVVTLPVEPDNFSVDHFRMAIARRMLSLPTVTAILATASSSSSSSMSARGSPTDVSAASIVAASASSAAVISNLTAATITGNAIKVLHVYKGSTNVCIRIEAANATTANANANADGAADDDTAANANAALLLLNRKLLAALLADYKANPYIYRDLLAVSAVRMGTAEDLAKPLADGLKPPGGADDSVGVFDRDLSNVPASPTTILARSPTSKRRAAPTFGGEASSKESTPEKKVDVAKDAEKEEKVGHQRRVSIAVAADDDSHDMAPPPPIAVVSAAVAPAPAAADDSKPAAIVMPSLGIPSLSLLNVNNTNNTNGGAPQLSVRSALKSPRVSISKPADDDDDGMEEHVGEEAKKGKKGGSDAEGIVVVGSSSSRRGSASPHRGVRLAQEVIDAEDARDRGDAILLEEREEEQRMGASTASSSRRAVGFSPSSPPDAAVDEDAEEAITAELNELVHDAVDGSIDNAKILRSGVAASNPTSRRGSRANSVHGSGEFLPPHHSPAVDDASEDYRPPTPIKRNKNAAMLKEVVTEQQQHHQQQGGGSADSADATAEAATKIQRFMGFSLRKRQANRQLEEQRKHERNRRANTVRFATTQEEEHAATVIAALMLKGAVAGKRDKMRRRRAKESVAIAREKVAISVEANTASSMISRALRVGIIVRHLKLARNKKVASEDVAARRQEEVYEAKVRREEEEEEAAAAAAEAERQRKAQEEAAAAAAAVVRASTERKRASSVAAADTVDSAMNAAMNTSAAASAAAAGAEEDIVAVDAGAVTALSGEGADATNAVVEVEDAPLAVGGSSSSSAALPFPSRPESAIAEINELKRLEEAEMEAEANEEHAATATNTADANDDDAAAGIKEDTSSSAPSASADATVTAAVVGEVRPSSAVDEVNELKRLMSAERRADAAADNAEPTVEDVAAATVAATTSVVVGDYVGEVRPSSALDEIAELKRLMSAERRADDDAAPKAINNAEGDGEEVSPPSAIDENEEDTASAAAPTTARSVVADPTPRTVGAVSDVVDAVITSVIEAHSARSSSSAAAAPSHNEKVVAVEERTDDGEDSQSQYPATPQPSMAVNPIAIAAAAPTTTETAANSAAVIVTGGDRLPIEDLVALNESAITSARTGTATPPPPAVVDAAADGNNTLPTSTHVNASRPTSAIKALRMNNRNNNNTNYSTTPSGIPSAANSRPTSGGGGATSAGPRVGGHRLPLEDLIGSVSAAPSRPTSGAASTRPSARASRAVAAAYSSPSGASSSPSSSLVPNLVDACATVQSMLRYQHSALIAAYWREKAVLEDNAQVRAFASTRIQCAYRARVARSVVADKRVLQRLTVAERARLAEEMAVEAALAQLRAMEEDEWANQIQSLFNQTAVGIYEAEVATRKASERLRLAALKIQCAWRCYNAKFMVEWMRETRLAKRREKAAAEAFVRESEAALKIQCEVRRRQARVRVGRVRAERDAARKAKADRELTLFTAALKIQCLVRSHNARYTARFLRAKKAEREQLAIQQRADAEAAAVKAIVDRDVKVSTDATNKAAAIKIQCAWRCYNARFQRRWRQGRVDDAKARALKASQEAAAAAAQRAIAQDIKDRNLDLVAPTVEKPEIDAQPLPQHHQSASALD